LSKNRTVEKLEVIRKRKAALQRALEKGRSPKWILRLWGRFIKTRDSFQCVCCNSPDHVQAHHIIRKCLYPWSAFDTGNGITLCRECHARVHAKFNGRADLNQPLGEGDDQDEWAFLFGLLVDDSSCRGLNQDEFYYLSDHVLRFSTRVQGYQEYFDAVMGGKMSRIKFAHEIWRPMPEVWYTGFVAQLIGVNLLQAKTSQKPDV